MSYGYFPELFLNQPRQMLPKEEKDEKWRKYNMDYWETLGLNQLQGRYKRIAKNYRMANGKIDPNDYTSSPGNIDSAYIDAIKDYDDYNVTSIKFFPIIPSFVNTLVGEFSRIKEEVVAKSVDRYGKSEVLQQKKQDVIDTIVNNARIEQIRSLQSRGIQPTEEMLAQIDQNARSLPELQKYYTQEYRDPLEEWATYQMEYNDLRFNFREKESLGFEDSIITDMEFYHIRLKDNDYDFENCNPFYTFAIKSHDVKYVQHGDAAGIIKMKSVAKVIDDHGYRMTEEQIKNIEARYRQVTNVFGSQGYPNDLYDPTKSRADQITNSEVARNRYYLDKWATDMTRGDMWDPALENFELNPFEHPGMVRVTELYWKSQRRLGFLTKIDERGIVVKKGLISEDYIVLDKPVYNTKYKERTSESLIFGEHIDWFWGNQVWKGVKIGGNVGYPTNITSEAIYLDVEPLEFQFNSRENIFECMLPIMGCIYSERNGESVSPVDRMRPYQVTFNLVMNKITDIEIDEFGSFVTFNQNTLPKNSLGQSWEQDRTAKAMEAIRQYKILPTDKSLTNLEGERIFGDEVRVVDASETNRQLGKMQIASWIRNEAFLSVGFNPQRVGQVSQYQSANGQQMATAASYAQTDKYFNQHSVELMPKVKEQMLMADRYYNIKKGGMATVSFLNSKMENVNFEIHSEKLLRDVGIFNLTSPDLKEVKAKLENYIITNGGAGINIFDVARVFEAKTPLEIISSLKESMVRAEETERQRAQEQMAQLQEQLRAQQEQLNAQLQQKTAQEEADRENSRYIADTQNQQKMQQGGAVDNSAVQNQLKQEEMKLRSSIEQDKLDLANRKLAQERYKIDLTATTSLQNPVAGENKKPIIKI